MNHEFQMHLAMMTITKLPTPERVYQVFWARIYSVNPPLERRLQPNSVRQLFAQHACTTEMMSGSVELF